MNWYIGILFWFLCVAIILRVADMKHSEIVMGKSEQRYGWIITIIIILPLVYWASQRYIGFGDTGVYMNSFEDMPTSFSKIFEYMDTVTKDKGFYVMSACIKIIMGDNVRRYLFMIAFVQAICLAGMYRKYSSDMVLSLFIFVASADYFSFMQNGIRQFMAVAVLLIATPYLLEKKYFRYILFVLIASLMHQSALLMIPIAIIAQGKAWNKRTIIMLITALIVVTFVGRFTVLLENMLTDTQYTNVVSDWQQMNDNGTNPLRVLVFSVPMLISLFGHKYIENEDDPVINLATNMSIISSGLYIISMVTSGIFIGRLPIYASTYAMGVLLPWEIDGMFNEASARILKIIMIICFLVFYYYQMHFSWGVI